MNMGSKPISVPRAVINGKLKLRRRSKADRHRPHSQKMQYPPTHRACRVSLYNDSTIEEAANILANNPKGLLMLRDELAGWIGSFDRYGGEGSDRAFYLECWNGGSHTVDRVKKTGQPVEVAYASLSILGGIQPDRLREALAGSDDGFTARFLYIWPTPCGFRPLSQLNQSESERRKDWLVTAARR